MNIKIAKEKEIDGMLLTGAVSLAPQSCLLLKQIDLYWQALDKKGTQNVWLSTANSKRSGSEDVL